MHQLKKRVDAVRHSSRTGRVRAFLQGRYRPWMIISGITFEGVESNLMLVNSEWTGRQVQARYHGQPEVLYPPVRWAQTPDSLKQRSLAFVSIGRIESSKRQVEAINILEQVRERGHRVTLDIIGDISDQAYAQLLHFRVSAAGSWVRVHHGINRKKVEELVSSCRYGLHTMLDEHFGIAVAELVRAGCLVFVPDSGGQVEIVGNEAALIYSSDDEAVERICDVLQSKAEQTRLGNFLATRSNLFTEHQFMNKLRSIVRDYNIGKS